jgi:hypothetical protein
MKYTLPIDQYLQRDHAISMRFCDHEGCEQEGLYPAPKSRQHLRDYYWFCLEHVRAYNAQWNYYAGMNETEIEEQRIHATKWERPTWPLGQKLKQHLHIHYQKDPLGFFEESLDEAYKKSRNATWFPEGSLESKSLKTLDLYWPLTHAELKKRYKELAKKHHPDANRTDPHATEKFKDINAAYVVLLKTMGREK